MAELTTREELNKIRDMIISEDPEMKALGLSLGMELVKQMMGWVSMGEKATEQWINFFAKNDHIRWFKMYGYYGDNNGTIEKSQEYDGFRREGDSRAGENSG